LFSFLLWLLFNAKSTNEEFHRVRIMVFNATFNNISIIYPEKTIDLPQVTGNPYVITPRHEHDTSTTLVVIDTDYTGSCKSNYHTITTTTAPGDICILVYYLILKWWLRPSALFNRTYIYYVYNNFCVTKNKYIMWKGL
jgi:hypothetical protein